MFTGLVEETGKLSARTPSGQGARLAIDCRFHALVLGESVSVDGVCLTVDRVTAAGFECDASHETLAVTTLGSLRVGGKVNLERAVPLATLSRGLAEAGGVPGPGGTPPETLVLGRMGGHIVSGHVDGVGTLAARRPVGTAVELDFAFPAELGRFIAAKGSITVNGVSLTVNHVREENVFDVVIIPHTQEKTSLDALRLGGKVNLEVDLLARYVARLLETSRGGAPGGNEASWVARLQRTGYM